MPEPSETPVRALFLITQLGLGGSEKQLVDLMRNLDRTRIDPSVLAFRGGGEREASLAAAQVHFTIIPSDGRPKRSRLRAIRTLVQTRGIEVVQSFDPISSLYAALVGGRKRGPGLISGYYTNTMPAFRLWLGFILLWRRMDWIICNSYAGASFLHRWCGIALNKLVIIPNGLDQNAMDHGPHAGNSLREELHLSPGIPLIGMVGKLNRDKNPMVLARAALNVHARFPRAVFCIVGSGPLEDRVREYLKTNQMLSYFHLIPARSDGPWLSREFDIGVLCSRQEGLPNVLLEYMHWEKPVVATRVGDCERVVDHGRTGWMVPSGDDTAFAETLCSLLANPEAAMGMGKEGKLRLEQHHGFERYLEAVTELLLATAVRAQRSGS